MRFLFVSRRLRGERFDAGAADPDDWIMVVDTDRCIACGACELACRLEHGDDVRALAATRPITVSAANSPDGGGPDGGGNGDGGDGGRMICLPHGCRHCADRCPEYDPYNFWTICPSARAKASVTDFCDTCAARLEQGQWPACATRCTMKTIYFGRPRDIGFVVAEKRLNEMGDVEFTG